MPEQRNDIIAAFGERLRINHVTGRYEVSFNRR
jgi:hypothetical protein